MRAKNQDFAPLKPYDTTMEENLSMYDRLPYQRDADLCNRESLKLLSGNVIKNFQCKFQNPVTIDNMDDVITYQIEKSLKETKETQLPLEEDATDQISASPEQIEELLTDSMD